jgi:hypothetical protein
MTEPFQPFPHRCVSVDLEVDPATATIFAFAAVRDDARPPILSKKRDLMAAQRTQDAVLEREDCNRISRYLQVDRQNLQCKLVGIEMKQRARQRRDERSPREQCHAEWGPKRHDANVRHRQPALAKRWTQVSGAVRIRDASTSSAASILRRRAQSLRLWAAMIKGSRNSISISKCSTPASGQAIRARMRSCSRSRRLGKSRPGDVTSSKCRTMRG